MNLLVLGFGYSARALARSSTGLFGRIEGTVRSAEKAASLGKDATRIHVHAGGLPGECLRAAISQADIVVASAAPGDDGDPFLADLQEVLAAAPRLRLVQYLSTVGVYGDHDGAWIDEAAELRPVSRRNKLRQAAENAWRAFGDRTGKAIQIHRLAGIYGPGRNALVDLKRGTARRVDKPGQVFNRIHVKDIAGALVAGIRYGGSATLNICDDEPASACDVVAFAAELLQVPPPPLVPFADAELTEMARSFYGANKRCSNRRLKDFLGYRCSYPTYRAGLQALFDAGEGKPD